MLVKGSDLSNTQYIKNKRAGVIVYTFHEGRLYFLLGVDRKTREYTDFGGGCKNNETLIQGAWREFQEESCGIFSILDKKCLDTSIAITSTDRDIAIFFVEAPTALLEIASPLFKHVQNGTVLRSRKCMENIDIRWVEDDDFERIAFDKNYNIMWIRIQKFLINNGDYDELKMKIALKRAITIPSETRSLRIINSAPGGLFIENSYCY